MKVEIAKDERVEDLECHGLKIIQNKNYYTFTSDSVVLANFIKLKPKDKCVEIGAGCGVISVLLTAKTPFDKIYAFEIQSEMARLAEKNVLFNDLQDKITVISDDVKNYKQYLEPESIDVVFSNPPYMKNNSQRSKNPVKDLARHDESLSITELCRCAYGMLKFGGRFFVVYTAERTCELIFTLMKHNLEPKRMFFTSNGKGKVILVIIEAVKGGKHGVEVLPELETNDVKGEYLQLLQTKYFGQTQT